MPLNLPWEASTYTVVIRTGPSVSGESAPLFLVPRSRLEELAVGGYRHLVAGIVADFQRLHPGQADDLDPERIDLSLADDREGGNSFMIEPLWIRDSESLPRSR